MSCDTRYKLADMGRAAERVKQAKREGKRVVFTNGCFDILHAGHVRYLAEARALGDFLVVGLNSDASVKSLHKSPERPLNPESDRAEVLCALANVDLVVIFNESTPLNLITGLMPHVLAKGGDWAVENMVGAREVLAAGGEVRSLPLLEGRSTTSLVERIRSLA